MARVKRRDVYFQDLERECDSLFSGKREALKDANEVRVILREKDKKIESLKNLVETTKEKLTKTRSKLQGSEIQLSVLQGQIYGRQGQYSHCQNSSPPPLSTS